MSTRHYEVIIVGGTLSATVAAALAAKRGMRGLLVDQGELKAGSVELLSDRIPLDEGSAVSQLVHAELGLRHELRSKTRARAKPLQIVFSDGRLDLEPEPAALANEIQRTLGPEALPAWTRAMSALEQRALETGHWIEAIGRLPKDGFFERHFAAHQMKAHAALMADLETSQFFDGLPRELVDLLLGLVPFATHLDAPTARSIRMIRFARPVSRFIRGNLERPDGQSLRQILLEVAQRGTIEVLHSALEQLEPGTPNEVRIAGERDRITADAIVDASRDLSGLQTIGIKDRARGLAQTLQAAAPKAQLFVSSFEVDRSVLPPAMSDRVLLLNGRRGTRASAEGEPEAVDRPILLLTEPAEDPRRARLTALHPLSSVDAHTHTLDRLETAVRARVERLVPFLSAGNIAVPRSPRAGRDPAWVLGHPLFDPELDPLTGVAGVPTRTPHRGIYAAGPSVLPGLGVEGHYLAALQAIDRVDERRGHKRPKKLAQRGVPRDPEETRMLPAPR